MNNSNIDEVPSTQEDQITNLVQQNKQLMADEDYWKKRALRFEALYLQLQQIGISDGDLDDGK
ncbi:MAG: hypothetical protein CTY12_06265 [Methylotenera sp.]|nr:MAG: hypothetical protein CTY12_06265 [Methylotenera sp.]